MAIIQQLQAESVAVFSNTRTDSVVLGAGVGRRLFVVAVCAATGAAAVSGNGPAPLSVTYGGVAMALVTDGTNLAQSIRLGAGLVATGVQWYVLRESQLPANGANNLVVTYPGTDTVAFVVGWWILENCDQSANVRRVANNGTTTTATNLACTVGGGGLSDAVLVASGINTTPGPIQITIGAIGLTEDFDVLTSNASRMAAGTDLTAPSLGNVVCDMTYSSTTRAVISAIRLAEFFPPDGQVALSQGPGSIVTLEAT